MDSRNCIMNKADLPIKWSRNPRVTLAVVLLLLILGNLGWLLGCDGKSAGRSSLTMNIVTITESVTWSNMTVVVNGKLIIESGATLTLENVTLNLNPEVEDSDTFIVNNGGLIVKNSVIRSRSGKQWNLEATGASRLTFENSVATNHTGIRAYDNTILEAYSSEIEEAQCHDNATLNIFEGSAVYIALFFDNISYPVNIPSGRLETGDDITCSFDYPSSSSTTGHINLESSDVWGFQLDLSGETDLTINGGSGIVLALHIENVGTITITKTITSDIKTNGVIDDFSGGPKFAFINSQIAYMNIYLGGKSNVTFNGANKVVECNVFQGAKLTFGANTSLLADLAQAYDQSELSLDQVTLITDDSHPSITAMDEATVYINRVNAIAGTTVYALGNGKVQLTGGLGWKDSMFEETDDGKITYTP